MRVALRCIGQSYAQRRLVDITIVCRCFQGTDLDLDLGFKCEENAHNEGSMLVGRVECSVELGGAGECSNTCDLRVRP